MRSSGDMVAYMDKLIGKLVRKLDELNLREDTLVIFIGDNGTGKGTRSMMGANEVIGAKGSTTKAGMHVPLIVSCPGRIKGGLVFNDLIDSTDFFPTLLEAAGVSAPGGLTLDGRSFFSQLVGKKAQPRQWIYAWYSPRQGTDLSVAEFAFNQQYKLYKNGRFFDTQSDPGEERPLQVSSLTGTAAAASKVLQEALDGYRGARPAELDAAINGAGKVRDAKKATGKKRAN